MTELEITGFIYKEIKKIEPSLIKFLTDEIEMILKERIKNGFDINNNKFPRSKSTYNKEAAYKYATRKYGSTEFASKSKSDVLRLTGHFIKSIRVEKVLIKNTNKEIQIDFTIASNAKFDDKKYKALGFGKADQEQLKKSLNIFIKKNLGV